MLRSLLELRGYELQATDGDIGRAEDFYFSDLAWVIRYLVADTGNWLTGRLVLISPFALGQPEWELSAFPVGLTREQIKESPAIDKEKPVSRQMEHRLHQYYGWPPYWRGEVPDDLSADKETLLETEPVKLSERHLRSAVEVEGYLVQASDGKIGSISDFIINDEDWSIRYLVIDTGTWLPGQKVLVPPAWAQKVDWAGQLIQFDLSRETIKNCPEYDPRAPVNREYEAQFYDYYGRPTYW